MDKKKLALVHIVKKELDLTDEEYRDILQKAAGLTTSKDLDDQKFRKLMNYFVRSRHYRKNPDSVTLRQKMFITALAKELGWDNEHLDNFVVKYYHKSHLGELSKKEAIRAIESLKHIKEHKK